MYRVASRIQGCLRPVEVGLGRRKGLGTLVVDLAGDVAGLTQILGPADVARGEIHPRLGCLDASLRLLEGGLIGALVDGEERISRLDDGTVDEMDLVDIARDPSPDVHAVYRFEAADEIVIFDDVLHHRLGDGNRGWRCILGDRRRREPQGQQGGDEGIAAMQTI